MDPMTVAIAGSVAAPVIGGLVGGIMGNSSRKQQLAMMQQAYAELSKVGLPPDLSKAVILKQFQSQGILTPELEQDINLAHSAVADIKEDNSLRNAQMESLGALGNLSRGGLSAGDRASFNELRNQVQRDAEAKRQQILQQMQAQGMGSSGAALISQLQGAQASDDQASANADRIAAQASQNALQALNQRAGLAGNVRSQDFNAAQAKAQAIDQRNQFLFQNSAAQQQRNIAAQNAAQQANLANQQRLSEMNAQQGNQELYRQNQAKQDYFNSNLGLAQAKANALNGQAGYYGQQAQNQQNMYSGLGNAVGQGFAAYGAYANRGAGAQQNPGDLTDEQRAKMRANSGYNY